MSNRFWQAYQRPEMTMMSATRNDDDTLTIRDPAYGFGWTSPYADQGGNGTPTGVQLMGGAMGQAPVNLGYPGYIIPS